MKNFIALTLLCLLTTNFLFAQCGGVAAFPTFQTQACGSSTMSVCFAVSSTAQGLIVSGTVNSTPFTEIGYVSGTELCVGIPAPANNNCTTTSSVMVNITSITCSNSVNYPAYFLGPTLMDDLEFLGLIPYQVTIYPSGHYVQVVQPQCDGPPGSATLLSANGLSCETVSGTSGVTGSCPGPGTPATLNYLLYSNPNTVCQQTFTDNISVTCEPSGCSSEVCPVSWVVGDDEICSGFDAEICVDFVPSAGNAMVNGVGASNPNNTQICLNLGPKNNTNCASINMTENIQILCGGNTYNETVNIEVHPDPFSFTVDVVQPECNGAAGSATLLSPSGGFCDSVTGTAGITGQCPGPGTNANLTYNFQVNPNSFCEAFYADVISTNCDPTGCGCPTVVNVSADPVCSGSFAQVCVEFSPNSVNATVNGMSGNGGNTDICVTVGPLFNTSCIGSTHTEVLNLDCYGSSWNESVDIMVHPDPTAFSVNVVQPVCDGNAGSATLFAASGTPCQSTAGIAGISGACPGPGTSSVLNYNFTVNPGTICQGNYSDSFSYACLPTGCQCPTVTNVSNETTCSGGTADVCVTFSPNADNVSVNGNTAAVGATDICVTVGPFNNNGCDANSQTEILNIDCFGSVSTVNAAIEVHPSPQSFTVDVELPVCDGDSGSAYLIAGNGTPCDGTGGTAGVAGNCPGPGSSSVLNYSFTVSAGSSCETTIADSFTASCEPQGCECPTVAAVLSDPICSGDMAEICVAFSPDSRNVSVNGVAGQMGNPEICVFVGPLLNNTCDAITYSEVVNIDCFGSGSTETASITIHPDPNSFNVAVIAPECDGVTGSASLIAADGSTCDSTIGTTGTTGACPGPGISGSLNYNFTVNAGTTCEGNFSDLIETACTPTGCACPTVVSVSQAEICAGDDAIVCVSFSPTADNASVNGVTAASGATEICVNLGAYNNEGCSSTNQNETLNISCFANNSTETASITVHPDPNSFNVAVIAPECDGVTGSATLISADGSTCDSTTGTTGVTGACPGPGTSGSLNYNFTVNAGTTCEGNFSDLIETACTPTGCDDCPTVASVEAGTICSGQTAQICVMFSPHANGVSVNGQSALGSSNQICVETGILFNESCSAAFHSQSVIIECQGNTSSEVASFAILPNPAAFTVDIVVPECDGIAGSASLISPAGTVCETTAGNAGVSEECPSPGTPSTLAYNFTVNQSELCEATFSDSITAPCACNVVNVCPTVASIDAPSICSGQAAEICVVFMPDAEGVSVNGLSAVANSNEICVQTGTLSNESCSTAFHSQSLTIVCQGNTSNEVASFAILPNPAAFTVDIVAPECDGIAGSASLISPAGTVCETTTGNAGVTVACPGPGTPASLDYSFTLNAGELCEATFSDSITSACESIGCDCPIVLSIDAADVCSGNASEICVTFDLDASNTTVNGVTAPVGLKEICVNTAIQTNDGCAATVEEEILNIECAGIVSVQSVQFNVHPNPTAFVIDVVEPDCDLNAGSASLISADGSICDSEVGVAGDAGICPGPGTPAVLNYSFTVNLGSDCEFNFADSFTGECLPIDCGGCPIADVNFNALTCGQAQAVNTTNGVIENALPLCDPSIDPNGQKGIWLDVAGNGEMISIYSGSDFASQLSVYRCVADELICLGSADANLSNFFGFNQEVSFQTIDQEQYLVFVNGNGVEGEINVQISFELTCPLNAVCDFALEVDCGTSYFGNNSLLTDLNPQSCNGAADGNNGGLWFTWIGNGETVVANIISGGTNFDTQIALYSGDCNALSCEDGVNVLAADGGESVTINSVLGQTYFFYIDGWEEEVGDFEFKLDCGAETVVDLRVTLEGAYDVNTSLMRTDLTNIIPLAATGAYGSAPYNYSGSEVLTAIPANMVDWVLVEARVGTPGSFERSTTTVETIAGVLTADGMIQDVNGLPLVFNTLSAGTAYYFVVRHRNHLDVMTSASFEGSFIVQYDFTTAEGQAYGNEQVKSLADGTFVMHAGDYDQDHVIQIVDFDMWNGAPALINVYHMADGTLDGSVQTTDFDCWNINKAKIGSVEVNY